MSKDVETIAVSKIDLAQTVIEVIHLREQVTILQERCGQLLAENRKLKQDDSSVHVELSKAQRCYDMLKANYRARGARVTTLEKQLIGMGYVPEGEARNV